MKSCNLKYSKMQTKNLSEICWGKKTNTIWIWTHKKWVSKSCFLITIFYSMNSSSICWATMASYIFVALFSYHFYPLFAFILTFFTSLECTRVIELLLGEVKMYLYQTQAQPVWNWCSAREQDEELVSNI